MNAALEAAHLNFAFGETGADVQGLNISDYTIFVPTDEAFKSIGSVLETADLETLQQVLQYHIIPNNVIFSPSLGNVTVPSLQGANLTFTVLPDGSAWVNNARITFPNTILYNGVAHVIDRLVYSSQRQFFACYADVLLVSWALETLIARLCSRLSRLLSESRSLMPPQSRACLSLVSLSRLTSWLILQLQFCSRPLLLSPPLQLMRPLRRVSLFRLQLGLPAD